MPVTIDAGAPPWAHELARAVNDLERRRVPVPLPSFSKADLPDAARYRGAWIHVTDDAGGATPAFSDGAVWRRPDRAMVA